MSCRALAVVVVVVVGLTVSSTALAHPTMLRHGYVSCTSCHADPSGSGLLTEYGRAQSDLLLRMRSESGAQEKLEAEPSPTAGFLWGAVQPPDWLLLSGNFRSGGLVTFSEGSSSVRPLLMASEVRAQATFLERLKVNGSLGFAVRGGAPAAVTPGTDYVVVSREHWLGVDLAEGSVLVRAGRMNLPFGLRNNEHTSWVRAATRTDTNVGQQHGLGVSYNGDRLRAEVMGIAGNYQLAPDAFRERGYAGFVELALAQNLALGVTSLVTTAERDVLLRAPLVRQAHGLVARYAPSSALAVLVELDALLSSRSSLGYVGWAQADYEVVRGLHLMATVEGLSEGTGEATPSLGGWLSAVLYFAPHCEARVDGIVRTVPSGGATRTSLTVLPQVHVFL